MNVKELISRLQNAMDHGANPEARVLAFDPDSAQWEKVSILVFNSDEVLIYTDDEGEVES